MRDKAKQAARMKAYNARPEQLKNRAERNAARRKMIEKGAVSKGDGKDVDHKRPISKGGTNADGNLRVVDKSSNRGHGMTKRPPSK
jgi:hypothetical protein